MTLMVDARVPVAFGTSSDVREGDALVNAGLGDTVGHAAGCACCTPRSTAAETLSRLFLQRARGEVAFFNRLLVVADAAGQEAVNAALQSDPLVSARFRPA